ncbi:hypothetical protein ILUMI_02731 [Ignelater luminosus]|uniref:Uncharacterized protein n=1 Tax=Ignelater luminosus TaxID=2038154 RepID=A0A8K0DC26_IGNLU|nr:hypothetical protein ILUMI_02731 [Ignelater luminosus]
MNVQVRNTNTPTAKLQSKVTSGNLANCTARFKKSKSAVEIYKDCMHVSDANALKGLPMLLEGFTATWWQGVKVTTTSWKDALDLLRVTYEQDSKTPTDIFICQARAIISQLPPDTLPEAVKLDMVYELLNKRIRKNISRDSLKNFSDLLTQVRLIEETFLEETPLCQKFANKINTVPWIAESKTTPPVRAPPISYYGCSKAGFFKANCPSCKKSPSTQPPEFRMLDVEPETFLELGNGYLDSRWKAQRRIPTKFLVLPTATCNNTLLGMNFIEDAMLAFNFKNKTLRFADDPEILYPLQCEASKPDSDSSIDINVITPLRPAQGQSLEEAEKPKPPISVPPYRMYPARKEILRQELDKLLQQEIIEECESAWAAPVVLVSKPSGQMRLCVSNALEKSKSTSAVNLQLSVADRMSTIPAKAVQQL